MDYLWLFYLIAISGNISGLGFAVCFGSVVALIIFGLTYMFSSQTDVYETASAAKDREARKKQSGKYLKVALTTLVAGALVMTVIPTKEDTLKIIAAVGVVEAAQSDVAKKIGSKSVEVIEQWLEELAPKKKDKKEKKEADK